MSGSLPRDLQLIDALETRSPGPLKRTLWRIARQGRDPLACSKAGGRWDDGSFEVLYTAESRDGAIAEMYFHLKRGQPVFPSKVTYHLHELTVSMGGVLDLTEEGSLTDLEVEMQHYGRMLYVNREAEYVRSQLIGETAHFLGFSGIRVPNARLENTVNAVVFCSRVEPGQLEHRQDHGVVDFPAWETARRNRN